MPYFESVHSIYQISSNNNKIKITPNVVTTSKSYVKEMVLNITAKLWDDRDSHCQEKQDSRKYFHLKINRLCVELRFANRPDNFRTQSAHNF